jgi:uncharacterized delta-60 repeat protein
VRLNSDGSLDTSFNTSEFYKLANASVSTIAIQKDGKIIVGGLFIDYSNTERVYKGKEVFNPKNIIRLNNNGSIDTTFKIGEGFNPWVNSIYIQADEKILVGGTFTSFNGKKCNHLIRLNKDGTRDSTFTLPLGFREKVNSITVQKDNKILVAGSLAYLKYEDKSKLIQRLHPNGTLDSSFNVGNSFVQLDVLKIKLSKTGKVIASRGMNYFQKTFNKDSSFCVVTTLHENGSIDTTFKCINEKDLSLPPLQRMRSIGSIVNDIEIQNDGKIIIAGLFTKIDDRKYEGIARLNTDGTVDTSFLNPQLKGNVYALLLLPNGQVIAAHNNQVIKLNAETK